MPWPRARSPIGGFSAQGEGASVTRGVPTSGRISNGAIVEKDTGFKLASLTNLQTVAAQSRPHHRHPHRQGGQRLSGRQRRRAPPIRPMSNSPMPANYPGGVMALLTDIEQVKVDPDKAPRSLSTRISGVIVMGADVRISTVAIAQGNLTIKVTETPQVSQPAPFSQTGDHRSGAAHQHPDRRQQGQQDRPCCRTACRCSTWSTASMPWAWARAISSRSCRPSRPPARCRPIFR